MDISFTIVSYKSAPTTRSPVSKSKEKDNSKDISIANQIMLGALLFGLIMMFILFHGTSQWIGVLVLILMLFSLMTFLFTVLYTQAIDPNSTYYQEPGFKHTPVYIGEKIHFLDNGINIISPLVNKNSSFLYSEMKQFKLQYNKSIEVHPDSYFRWEIAGKLYQYPIVLNSSYSEQQLLKVLKYCYQKEIPIQEFNQDGEKIHLLKAIVKPEPPKKIEIDPKIQLLIDEIGEKEEK